MARTSGIDDVVMHDHWRNQPRDPKGTETGGQWTDGGNISEIKDYVSGKENELNSAKNFRLANAYALIGNKILRAEAPGGSGSALDQLHTSLLDEISDGNSEPGSNLYNAVNDVLAKFFS